MIVPPRHRFDAVLTIRQSPSERVVREAIVTRVLGKERKLIISSQWNRFRHGNTRGAANDRQR